MAQERLQIRLDAIDNTKKAFNGLKNNTEKAKSALISLRGVLLTIGAGAVIKGFFNAGVQIENLEVQLKALFGSAKAGKDALKQVTDFASTTPFELKNIQQGITALATVRKQAEQSGVSFDELLMITGNTATLLGNDFALASLQVQRSFSAGISSAELFRERGVKAMAGFKDGVRYNSGQSIIGLKKAFGTGGEFGNLIDELANTLFGTISNLKDAFFIFQVEVSKGFFGALKENLGDLKKSVEENRKTINEFADVIGTGLSNAISGTAKVLMLVKRNMTLIVETFKLFLAYKLVAFFYSLTIAIKGASIAMLAFNRATKKNLLIAGGALLISQLDKIINKLKEIGVLSKDEAKPKEEDSAVAVVKQIPKSTFMDKLNFQLKLFAVTLRDVTKTTLSEMNEKFKSIGETIAMGALKSVKAISTGIAESLILGKNLAETFRQLAQKVMVNIIAQTIERILLMGIEKLLAETIFKKEKDREGAIKRQNAQLKQQIALQAILFALGGGGFGGFFAEGGKVEGRADGGSTRGMNPYVVGERGRELFIPSTDGTIVPNNEMGGIGATNINFTVQATDVKGVQELLIDNRATITNIINTALNQKGKPALV
mgnify:CR=1 FL=1